jgi:hypothetical protein
MAAVHLAGVASLWYRHLKPSRDDPHGLILFPASPPILVLHQQALSSASSSRSAAQAWCRTIRRNSSPILSCCETLPDAQERDIFTTGLLHPQDSGVALQTSSTRRGHGPSRSYEHLAAASVPRRSTRSGTTATTVPVASAESLVSAVSIGSKPFKRLTPTEMNMRRSQGCCLNCDEKFSPVHRCKQIFALYIALW